MVTYRYETGSNVVVMLLAVWSALMVLMFAGWMFMLLLGMFAGYMAMPGLALGYWASVGILFMLRLVFVKVESES